MFHPFEGDLTQLKDSELEEKIFQLNKKYYQAYRLGKPELLTQIATFVTIYKEEMSRRYRQKMQGSQGRVDNDDLDQLINVD
jgi:cyclopropane fatty-acyl-phospholipid synthase-like methyltransferase